MERGSRLDALPEGVGEDRVPEIAERVDGVVLFRGRGQPDLDRGREVLDHPSPGRVLRCAAAVTLVDDHKVEEVGRVLAEQLGLIPPARERLVGREVDLSGPTGATGDPPERTVTEGHGEVLPFRLLYEGFPVGEVEDTVVAVRGHDPGVRP